MLSAAIAPPMALPPPAELPKIGLRTLCPLVMVGDPDLDTTRATLDLMIERGVRMVEFCTPFPDPFTDGATLQRAHARALEAGAGFEQALDLVEAYASRLAIVMLTDFAHVLRPLGFETACRQARAAGAAAILPHGLPPRMRPAFLEATRKEGVSMVGTIYADGKSQTRDKVLRETDGFVYVVSRFGRSGGGALPALDMKPVLGALRRQTPLPLALGFGLRSGADVTAAFADGADIAIVGSAFSAAVERGIENGAIDVELDGLLRELLRGDMP